jgi:ribosomal protein S18 acetylase RimI-like enzyme
VAGKILIMEIRIRRLEPGSPAFPSPIGVTYRAHEHYAVSVESTPDGARFLLNRAVLIPPALKELTIEWNSPDFQPAEDYGLFVQEALVGMIELFREDWTNRLRITGFWVGENHRRKGFGSELLRHAIRRARELGCRAVVLETQSCNMGAIACYQKNGFRFIGLDTIHYSDEDVARGEVRLEMGFLLKEVHDAEQG